MNSNEIMSKIFNQVGKKVKKYQTCTKIRYNTKLQAIAALLVVRNVRASQNDPTPEKRYYKCPSCSKYHLTSH